MISDPKERGRALARLFHDLSPRMLRDLEEAGFDARNDAARVAREWECLALYACVRGLIAAGGFNRETAVAIDAFHDEALLEPFLPDEDGPAEREDPEARRARVAERYAEYGAIGQAAEHEGPGALANRLGSAGARHMSEAAPSATMIEVVGALHEALAEGAAESVRRADTP